MPTLQGHDSSFYCFGSSVGSTLAAWLQERGVSVEGRLLISDRAHLLFDLHKEIDGAREAELAGEQDLSGDSGLGPVNHGM